MTNNNMETITRANINEYHDRYLATVRGEVRKVQYLDTSFISKDGVRHEGAALFLTLDDENSERYHLVDKDLAHEYERGAIYNFKIRIDQDYGYKGRTKIVVVSATPISDIS